jgi:hypothetical protein
VLNVTMSCCAVLCLQAEDKAWADLSVEMSEVALLVAEGIWDDLLQDTADTVASIEKEQQQDQYQQQQQAEGLQQKQQSAGLLQAGHALELAVA